LGPNSYEVVAQHLGQLQHLCVPFFASGAASAHAAEHCRWQQLQLEFIGMGDLCYLPELPCLVKPLSVGCLRLWLSDDLQPAIARVAECSKLGLEVQELEVNCYRADRPEAHVEFLQQAAPLIQTLAPGGTLSVCNGKPTSAVLAAVAACGMQHRIKHLELAGGCVPTACFWQAAPHTLQGVKSLALRLEHFDRSIMGGSNSRQDMLTWLRETCASAVPLLNSIPGPVTVVVVVFGSLDAMQAAAPTFNSLLCGAVRARITCKVA
jgi:hypothetical protein